MKTALADDKNGLSSLFQMCVNWFFYIQLTITLVELAKMTFIYTYFGLYNFEALTYGQNEISGFSHALNFLFMPEISPVSSSNLFIFEDYWKMATNLFIFSSFVSIFVKTERKYLENLEKQEDEVNISIFTLVASQFKTEKEAKEFIEIVKMQHPTDDIVVDCVFVFNLEEYRKLRNLSSTKNKIYRHFDLEVPESGESEVINPEKNLSPIENQRVPSVLCSEKLLREKSLFTGKIFIVLNDLHVVRSILYLHQSGLFIEKLKSDIAKKMKSEESETESIKILKRATEGYISKIKIEISRDLSDIHFQNLEKNQCFSNSIKIAFCFVICAAIFTIVFFLKYFSTLSVIKIDMNISDPDFRITLFGQTISFSVASICGNFSIVIVSTIGSLLIQAIIFNIKFHYYSHSINASFIVETIYLLSHQFLAIYFGFKKAVFDVRNLVDSTQYSSLLYISNFKFSTYGTGVLIGIWIRYLLMIFWQFLLKKCTKKNIQGNLKEIEEQDTNQIVFIEHSFFAVNVVTSYFYFFFYQHLMSPIILITLTLFLLLNMYFFKRELKHKDRKKKYLSFDHMCTFICFVLLVGSIGSSLATITVFDFYFRYFTEPGFSDAFFPVSLITAITVFFIYFLLLINLKSHDSLSMRVIDFMIDRQLDVRKMEKIEEINDQSGYKNFNSWDQESFDLFFKKEGTKSISE